MSYRMKPSEITLKRVPQAMTWRNTHWWLAVLGTGLMLLLGACGGSPPVQVKHATRPKLPVVPLSATLLQARANAQTQIQQFEQSISQAEQHGMNVSAYRLQLDDDLQNFQDAQSEQAYNDLATALQAQAFALEQGLTRYDMQALQTLIGQTNIINDYEYNQGPDALGDQRANLESAQTLDDYQAVDTQLTILLTNLQALLANLNDPTPHDAVHATDLQLIQHYNLTGKVMVTSLTEQTLRLYQDGQLVRTISLVTGRQERPSPPGLWHIFFKGTRLIFSSSEPRNSPLWSPPSLIQYGMEYHEGGFFYHDATWRTYFGPGANLPHNDETSGVYSNDGSHGCINMTLDDAAWLYSWVEVGTPTIIY
jgi:hypothetical protein